MARKKGGNAAGQPQQKKEVAAPAKAQQPKQAQQQQKKGGQPQKQQAQQPQKQQAQQPKQAQPQQQKKGGQQQVKKEKAAAAPGKGAQPQQKKAKVETPKVKKEEVAQQPEEEQEEELQELPEPLQAELAELQQELAKISEEELKAVAKITREFNGKRRPTLEKRKNTINKIPGFWLQALASTPAANLITDDDAEIFQHLKDISVVEPTNDEADKDKSDNDFKIVFTFDKNPFFQNKQLWKEVKYASESEEPTVTNSTISWNKGKNPSEKKPKQEAAPEGKQKGKRPIDDVDDEVSFFEFFTSTDEDGVELGEWFRDEFVPNAIKFFFGDVSDDEDDLDDMDSEEEAEFARRFEAGEFGEDDGDDDDDDDDEDGDE